MQFAEPLGERVDPCFLQSGAFWDNFSRHSQKLLQGKLRSKS